MTICATFTLAQRLYAQLRSRPFEIVHKRDIITALWGGKPPKYSDDEMRGIVCAVRKTLPPGEEIKSVHGRGYRLTIASRPDLEPFPAKVARIEREMRDAAEPKRSRSHGGNDRVMQEYSAERREQLAKRTMRECITCKRVKFLSEGPNERMCKGCRAMSHTVSPYAL